MRFVIFVKALYLQMCLGGIGAVGICIPVSALPRTAVHLVVVVEVKRVRILDSLGSINFRALALSYASCEYNETGIRSLLGERVVAGGEGEQLIAVFKVNIGEEEAPVHDLADVVVELALTGDRSLLVVLEHFAVLFLGIDEDSREHLVCTLFPDGIESNGRSCYVLAYAESLTGDLAGIPCAVSGELCDVVKAHLKSANIAPSFTSVPRKSWVR